MATDTASMLISVSPRQSQDKAPLNSSAGEFTLVEGLVFYVIRYRGLADESYGLNECGCQRKQM